MLIEIEKMKNKEHSNLLRKHAYRIQYYEYRI